MIKAHDRRLEHSEHLDRRVLDAFGLEYALGRHTGEQRARLRQTQRRPDAIE